jgi:hypothetical protein
MPGILNPTRPLSSRGSMAQEFDACLVWARTVETPWQFVERFRRPSGQQTTGLERIGRWVVAGVLLAASLPLNSAAPAAPSVVLAGSPTIRQPVPSEPTLTCFGSAPPPHELHFLQSAWATSTGRRKPICVTGCGPPDRLQRRPRALARPGQIQGSYARFAAARLSAPARERLRRPGRGGGELAAHPASAGPPRNDAARRQEWRGRRIR